MDLDQIAVHGFQVGFAQPAPVQLPPMVVSDGGQGPPWLYTRADDFELLARCSRSTVRDFVRMRMR